MGEEDRPGNAPRPESGDKEILNKLLNSRYRITEFLYCTKQGWLESSIAKKECGDWEWVEE